MAFSQKNIADTHNALPDLSANAPDYVSNNAQINARAANEQNNIARANSMNTPDTHDRLSFIQQNTKLGEFAKADIHSKRVGKLKFILPALGMAVVILIIGITFFHQVTDRGISISGVGLEDGKLVMNNPTLNGLDSNKRPFKLTASKAIQSVEDPTLIELISIKARLPMEDNVWADIEAGNGNYDTNSKKLDLGGGIDIKTNNGIVMVLEDAYLDLDKGMLRTDRIVTLSNESTEISAQSLQILNNGERIIFNSDVKMVVQPQAWQKGSKIAESK